MTNQLVCVEAILRRKLGITGPQKPRVPLWAKPPLLRYTLSLRFIARLYGPMARNNAQFHSTLTTAAGRAANRTAALRAASNFVRSSSASDSAAVQELLAATGRTEKQEKKLRLRVIVIAAKHLPKMDTFGANDPYVEVSTDNVMQRTTTIDSGGSNPCWGAGKGEALEFDISTSCQEIQVRCLDEDTGSANDKIGEAFYNLTQATRQSDTRTHQEWVSLQDETGAEAGSVNIICQCWDPEEEDEPLPPTVRCVEVCVLSARNLPKMDTFSATDPYVMVSVAGVKQRTTTIDNGGANPIWGQWADVDQDGVAALDVECGEKLSYQIATAPGCLVVQCFDKDIGSADDIIGTGEVNLRSLIKKTTWDKDLWVPLVNSRNEPRGDVHIVVKCREQVNTKGPSQRSRMQSSTGSGKGLMLPGETRVSWGRSSRPRRSKTHGSGAQGERAEDSGGWTPLPPNGTAPRTGRKLHRSKSHTSTSHSSSRKLHRSRSHASRALPDDSDMQELARLRGDGAERSPRRIKEDEVLPGAEVP
jgi:hypothetical protein